MKIGIFLGYGPQVILGKEGLGRYLGGLLKGFQELDHSITIACPYWLKNTLNDLLDTFSVNKERISIITTSGNPPLWQVYSHLYLKKRKNNGWRIIFNKGKVVISTILYRIGSSQSFVSFVFWIISLVLLLLFATFPFLIILLLRLTVYLKEMIGNRAKEYILRTKISKLLIYIRYIIDRFFIFDWQLQLFKNMTNFAINTLVDEINKKNESDVWFIPSIFWPQTVRINGTVVLNAPDLVSQEFPQEFANLYSADVYIKDCRESLLKGKYFITYCNYLRRKLLIEQYAKDNCNTCAITHANNDMLPYIKIETSINEYLNSNNDWSDIFARDLIEQFGGRNIKYIFYASQLRPNKNMLNLIKAYEYLVREKFLTHKLYVTANLDAPTEVGNYVREHRLEGDIISVFNVPAQTLAALYHCSDLVVNPTLYEGGFPFTFGEGMSVGTPSIMSDIPQVRDVLEPAGLEDIMFDPYDWHAIADKIEWALSNLEGLYQKELPLYQEMEKRTYSVVAAEYVNAFEKFIDLDNINTNNNPYKNNNLI